MWCNNIINASTICLLFLITTFFFHSFPSTSLIFFPFLRLTTILHSSPDCYITLRSKLFSYLCLYSSFPLSHCRCPFLFFRHDSSPDPHFSSSPPSLRFFYTFLYLFFGCFPSQCCSCYCRGFLYSTPSIFPRFSYSFYSSSRLQAIHFQ